MSEIVYEILVETLTKDAQRAAELAADYNKKAEEASDNRDEFDYHVNHTLAEHYNGELFAYRSAIASIKGAFSVLLD